MSLRPRQPRELKVAGGSDRADIFMELVVKEGELVGVVSESGLLCLTGGVRHIRRGSRDGIPRGFDISCGF